MPEASRQATQSLQLGERTCDVPKADGAFPLATRASHRAEFRVAKARQRPVGVRSQSAAWWLSASRLFFSPRFPSIQYSHSLTSVNEARSSFRAWSPRWILVAGPAGGNSTSRIAL